MCFFGLDEAPQQGIEGARGTGHGGVINQEDLGARCSDRAIQCELLTFTTPHSVSGCECPIRHVKERIKTIASSLSDTLH